MRFKPRSCVYCKRKRIRKSGYSFFKFPLDKSSLLKKWLDSMGIKNWIPDKSSVLCSGHFEQTCLRKIGGKYLTLKDGSVPTIFNKVDCFNNIKSGIDHNLNQKMQFIGNNKSDLVQKASCSKLTQTYLKDENIDTLLIPDNTGIINLDHHYHISPSTLTKKLTKCQKSLKNKRYTIKLQKQQLQRFQKCITTLKETIKELQYQRMISEKCLNCMSMVITHAISEYSIKSENI